MIVLVDNIKIYEDFNTDEELVKHVCKRNNLPDNLIIDYKIIKKSIDARNKKNIFYLYSIYINFEEKLTLKELSKIMKKHKSVFPANIEKYKNDSIDINIFQPLRKSGLRPVIVGAGPAGLFCALTLIENGITPIIIEQGKKVEERQKDVEEFFKTGTLNKTSNVQFGEGGAGTFSDGKLTTNLHNQLCKTVINEFVRFGAPKQISYINKPHIGTDNLIKIVSNIRKYIIKNGGVFLFETKVKDFEILDNKIESVTCITLRDKKIEELQNINNYKYNDNILEIKTDTIILAIGHSSRDMIEKLYEKKVEIEKKVFSVGLRIEHKQELINKAQYGEQTRLKLPPAEYKLAYHNKETGKSCYTFCMCPGGDVIASSSEDNTIVTNGMSKFARDGENANSAILVNVTPEDFMGESPLEGIYFQKELEENAFKLGGGNFKAPIQRVEDFLKNEKTIKIGQVIPTYKPGVTLSNLHEILPDFISNTLMQGIIYFGEKINGFDNPDAILTGVETRSSSPVTIKRNDLMMSNIKGLYPCGEGAGYAGGIMSAAVDGIKVAQSILIYNNP